MRKATAVREESGAALGGAYGHLGGGVALSAASVTDGRSSVSAVSRSQALGGSLQWGAATATGDRTEGGGSVWRSALVSDR